ncbi:hypothetical protein DRO33_05290, partial [Candidatus Bathyarchaeota archaeon]
IARMSTIEEINALGEKVEEFFDRTLEKLPDNPILAVRQLETRMTVLDSMLGLQVEAAPTPELEEVVEAELERLTRGEVEVERPPELEVAAPEAVSAEAELDEETKRKLEELKRKLLEAGERA